MKSATWEIAAGAVTDLDTDGSQRAVGPPAESVTSTLGVARARAEPSAPAFREVYERYFGLVWRTLRRSGVPESSVEDAAQETFVQVHRSLATFEGRASISTWVYRIARNVALNQHRYAARRWRERDHDELDDDRDRDPHDDPERHAEQRDAWHTLARLLGQIPESRREVLVLADVEDLPAPEIAEMLGIPSNTVYSRLRIARRELEALVEREGAEP